MKHPPGLEVVRIFVILCAITDHPAAHAGTSDSARSRQHEGLYFSVGLGIGNMETGSVYNNGLATTEELDGGSAVDVELKIGFTFWKSVVVSVDNFYAVAGKGRALFDFFDYSRIERSFNVGAGLTYYLMPYNLFLSGSVGVGFSKNTKTFLLGEERMNSRLFPSLFFKAGKEFWVSDNLGVGLSIGYRYFDAVSTSADYAKRSPIETIIGSVTLVFN